MDLGIPKFLHFIDSYFLEKDIKKISKLLSVIYQT